MANQEHLDILKKGVDTWNEWRKQNPEIKPDLSRANLSAAILEEVNFTETNLQEANLQGASLSRANFWWANLQGANLSGAKLFSAHLPVADLSRTDFRGATLFGADLTETRLFEADLSGSDLRGAEFSDADLQLAYLNGANLLGADLSGANLSGATLQGANLQRATLSDANLSNADLSGCSIYAISAWGVRLEETKQTGLIITKEGEPTITVDNLEVAQFIYLLLNNDRIRYIIDTITSKVVLILGRFTDDRIVVLKAVKAKLLQHGYSPVLFDFKRPLSRDFSETVRTLAHLSRFIIADITEPSSIPQELQTIVPDLEVPVQPILEEGKREYAMFPDFGKYSWVFPLFLYKDQESLIASLQEEIIKPADKKARELALEKAKRLQKS